MYYFYGAARDEATAVAIHMSDIKLPANDAQLSFL